LTSAPAEPSVELSDDEQQNLREEKWRSFFILREVMDSPLFTFGQKVFLGKYISTTPGPWRHYNDVDFKVVESKVVNGVWHVSFGVYFDDYEAQRIDVEIPLSE
jgi:hypothetical protein